MTGTDVIDSELFLPEPEPRDVFATLISVDDHLVEPADMFDGRLPSRLQPGAPKVVRLPSGNQVWEFDGRRFPEIGLSAVSGRVPDTVIGATEHPARYEDMRRGCYDIHARVEDMDLNGVWASLNFPSVITGFCGRVYSTCRDPELGLAVTRAYNDWVYEAWYSPYPERIIPCGITWLADPQLGAQEIRRNAERGFRAVTLPERPHCIGLPSILTDYWEPILRACAETDTVVNLHVGSSGLFEVPADATRDPGHLRWTMFGILSATACTEWLWSGWPAELPDLKVVLSEGGLGWVPGMIDRLDKLVDTPYNRASYMRDALSRHDLRPSEILRRNFWFCAIDDPSTMELRHVIGVENILAECDYPHPDSTWPDTQAAIAEMWGHLPASELRAICCENAAQLYGHPLPDGVRPLG